MLRSNPLPIFHKTPLAWLNLLHVKSRLFVATGGICFATTLIFMQLGFLGAVLKTATLIYDNLDFDILLVSRKSLDATVTQPLSRQRLYQAAGIEGVTSVKPLYIAFKQWRNPETKLTRAMLVMGFNSKNKVFKLLEISNNLSKFQRQDTVLFDRLSRPEFGSPETGVFVELGGRRQKVMETYELGPSLRFDGSVIVSDQNFIRLFRGRSLDDVSLGLIAVQSQTEVGSVIQKLRKILPENIEVLSRQQAELRDQNYWLRSTSIGYIFSIGAIMGFIVGSVIVYQILYTDVTDHLQEYATLKAIGYSNVRLSLIILQEAIILAILGYTPGLVLSCGLYQLAHLATGLPIAMSVNRATFMFCVTLLMCGSSSLLSIKKVLDSNPADIFG